MQVSLWCSTSNLSVIFRLQWYWLAHRCVSYPRLQWYWLALQCVSKGETLFTLAAGLTLLVGASLDYPQLLRLALPKPFMHESLW